MNDMDDMNDMNDIGDSEGVKSKVLTQLVFRTTTTEIVPRSYDLSVIYQGKLYPLPVGSHFKAGAFLNVFYRNEDYVYLHCSEEFCDMNSEPGDHFVTFMNSQRQMFIMELRLFIRWFQEGKWILVEPQVELK